MTTKLNVERHTKCVPRNANNTDVYSKKFPAQLSDAEE